MAGQSNPFRTRTRSESFLPIVHDSPVSDVGRARPRRRPSHVALCKILAVLSLLGLITYEACHLGGTGLDGVQDDGDVPRPRSDAVLGGSLRVEFGAPGLFVPLQDALNLDFPSAPEELALLELLPEGGMLPPGKLEAPQVTLSDVMKQYVTAAGGQTRRRLLEAGAESGAQLGADNAEELGDSVRVMVGITSACCSPKTRVRRDAVRATWLKRARALHPDIDVAFFLSQPENASVAAAAMPAIAEELALHDDMIIVRGPDTYLDLPNKTFRMLRFVLAHPKGYTHVLKTDDDCYLRAGELLEALRKPWGPQGFARLSPGTPFQGQAQTELSSTRRAVEQLAAQRGLPLHTDGITLYNDRGLATGSDGKRRYVDDEEGTQISVAALVGKRRAKGGGTKAGARAEAEGSGGGRRLAGDAGHGGAGDAAGGPGSASPVRPFRMSGVYLGCMENKAGFHPIRDPTSKWYVSEEQLPNSAVPFGVKYLAGWGYVLSRDLVTRVVHKTNIWGHNPDAAPAWFTMLAWEDVLIGMMLMDVVEKPEDHRGFRAAWRSCPANTVLRHLDVDAPALLQGLYEQEQSGLWAQRPIQCSTGRFLPGDYSGWKAWRDTLTNVERL